MKFEYSNNIRIIGDVYLLYKPEETKGRNSLKRKRLDKSANLSRRSFSEDGRRINIEEATKITTWCKNMGTEKITVVWRATQVILNSTFDLPPDRNIISIPPKEEDNANKSKITERSKMTIFDGEIIIIFDDNKVSVERSSVRNWAGLEIVYYLIYKTFLYYNCIMPEEESTEVVREVDSVAFKLHRYVTKDVERDGKTMSYIDTEPCEIVLNKKDITDYLMVIDQTILYAICYYISGCNTQQYFLIEFYKCLEVIRNRFGGERKMKKVLQPHGFLEAFYEKAKKLANDQTRPLSISRHAPRKEVSVHNVNTKWLFSDPIGREAFETGEKACRNIIDSYLQFRIADNS